MVRRTLKAFSLAEMMISMTIVMLISVAAVPVVTQQKPDIKQTNIRGQYACWRDNGGSLRELRCDERACRSEHVVSECKLVLDNRPAHFLVFAVGSSDLATNGYVPGQIVSDDNPSLAADLEVNVPCITCSARNEGPTTITSSTASTEYSAASGAKLKQELNGPTNGLALSNVKRCNLLSVGQSCPNGYGNQESCSIVNNVESDEVTGLITSRARILINGCSGENLIGETVEQFYENVNLTRETNKIYTADGNRVRMSFDLHDSMYTAKEMLPTTNGADSENIIEKLLASIPVDRHSTLVTNLKNHFDGNSAKNGAVLILW